MSRALDRLATWWYSLSKRAKRIVIICTIVLSLTVIYYAMLWSTPPDCMVSANRMTPDCIDFVYPS